MAKKTLKGKVVSTKMNKTVVVEVKSLKEFPKYKRKYKFHKKYKVHDEEEKCRKGDKVVIEETRPYSKEKRWRVVKIEPREEVGVEDEKGGEDDIKVVKDLKVSKDMDDNPSDDEEVGDEAAPLGQSPTGEAREADESQRSGEGESFDAAQDKSFPSTPLRAGDAAQDREDNPSENNKQES